MAGITSKWVSLLLIGLFAYCIIFFAFTFIGSNNPTSGVLNNSAYNQTFVPLNASLSDVQSTVQDKFDKVSNSSSWVQSIISPFLILDLFVSVPFNIIKIGLNIFTLVFKFVFVNIFGANFYAVSGIIIAILVGTILFLIMKFIRTGESER